MTGVQTCALPISGALGLTGSALAQGYGTRSNAQIAPNAEKGRVVVAERVISENPTVIERQVVIGAVRVPDRNTGISRIGGSVGGAIGGYYINGTTAADNIPLNIPPSADAYNR